MAQFAVNPSFISFAGGYPAADAFDFDGIRRASEKAWSQGAKDCLQYGATEGVAPLRAALKALGLARGIHAEDDQLMVTTGSQQALDFLLRATVAPGDTVLVERPTYPGALQAFRLAGARVVGIDGDAEGIDPQAVARAIEAAPSKPKMIYVVPTFANPTGATMSESRRRDLLALAAKHDILLVEDDPYGLLRFSGDAVAPIAAHAAKDAELRKVSVYLSTLSKVAVPALRIGWMVASSEVTRRCVMAKQVSDLCTSPWMQHIGAAYLDSPEFAAHVPRIIATYKERADAMVTALHQAFDKEWVFLVPDGGMFLWVKLPRGVDAGELLKAALAQKVVFVPGAACYASEPDAACLRMSYSTASPEVIREGVARLAHAYRSYCVG
ncbi:aminotransferase-like domain-containing protein [Variovorax boronicumulans]